VGTMSGGTISGSSGNNTFNVTGDMLGGTINTGAGTNTVHIGTYSGGTITANSLDHVHIDSLAHDYTMNTAYQLDVTNNNAWNITGNTGNDSITLGSMSGGTINGGLGNDHITVTDMHGGTVSTGGGTGTETVEIGALSGTGNTIQCGTGDDSITINNVANDAQMTIEGFGDNGNDVIDLSGSGVTWAAVFDNGALQLTGGNNEVITIHGAGVGVDDQSLIDTTYLQQHHILV